MNIIINGGSRGIGKETALFLAQDINNQIIVTGRNISGMNSISAAFPNIHCLRTDLSVQEEISGTFREKVRQQFTKIDVVINMAGALISKEFMAMEDSDARMMMETNFFGPAAVIRLLVPLMEKGAHIVNISSMGGFQGSSKFKGLSYYSASKAALACLSECLAEEFRGLGISVNCLSLGAVQTEMFAEAFPGHSAPVRASDIASFISYFALNGHKFMNGKNIPVALSNP
jgi:3-oxoacyl-[acyl-carrier protein] reductase